MSFQLKQVITKPHIHKRNAAERAICTFKNHLTARIASVDATFPMNQWDKLIDQAIITLNLLHPAHINPALLAYSYLFGLFNYSATPLAPPGI